MNLLALPVDIWTSYGVPLVDMSGMVRLAGCSRVGRNLTHHALQQAQSMTIVAPNDLHACLTWLGIRSICIDQLVIDRHHHCAIATATNPKFDACVRQIALKCSKGSTNTGVCSKEMLFLLHRKLTVLEIEAPEGETATLMNILGCQNLRSITYMLPWRYGSCNQTWLAKLIRVSPGLRELHIGHRSSFVGNVFAAIAERKDTLTDVTLLVGISSDNEHDLLHRLLESCPSLRRLTFGMGGEIGQYGDGLVGMEGKCPHLEVLNLPYMKFPGDSVVKFILSCPKLRVCHADGGCIKSHTLEQWHRQRFPKLHDFGLYWAVEQLETVVACAALFEEVRTYHMHCSEHWETAAEALAYMPHLHTVFLYSHPVLHLPYLPRYCSQLRELRIVRDDLYSYAGEIGEALTAALPSLPRLEVLQWIILNGLGETGLMALAQHCPNLRSLDCRCVDVTDAGLMALVRGCSAMRTLLLFSCNETWVTDAFLHAIAQHCPYLEELRLPGCGWQTCLFSKAVVTEVLAACTLLRELQVPPFLKDGVQASTLVVPAGRLRRLTISVI